RAAVGDGDVAFCSLLRAEGLWSDVDLQRCLYHSLPRRCATLAAVVVIRGLGAPGDQHPGSRRLAPRRAGKSAAAADCRKADSGDAAGAHPTTFPSLARWV